LYDIEYRDVVPNRSFDKNHSFSHTPTIQQTHAATSSTVPRPGIFSRFLPPSRKIYSSVRVSSLRKSPFIETRMSYCGWSHSHVLRMDFS